MNKTFKILHLLIILTLFLSNIALSQTNSIFSSSIEKDKLIATMKYSQVENEEDTSFFYTKKVQRAFLMSLVLPGAGELYVGSKIKAVIFAGTEAALWTMYYSYTKKGNNLIKKYKKFADEHWDLKRWYLWGLENELTGLRNTLNESHFIWILNRENNKEYIAIDDSLDKYLPEWEQLIVDDKFSPVKTDEYYENIGKYDQFASGWDDFRNYNQQPDTIIVSPNRDKYLSMRWNANKTLQTATNIVSVVMFNHIISAFDALITAKHAEAKERKKVSVNAALITNYAYRNPIRGIRLYFTF